MKQYKYIFIPLLLFVFYVTAQVDDPEKIGTINLYYVCKQTNTNHAPQTSTVITSPLEKTGTLLSQLRSLSWLHKGKLFIGTVTGSYSSILGKLLFTTYRQYKQPSWAQWKQTVPLEVLTHMVQDVVAQELITTIYEKNRNDEKIPTPQLKALYNALQEIDYELLCLHKATYFYRMLEYTQLNKILPYSETDHTNALEKIERLAYLKNLLENIRLIPAPIENRNT